jgi:1-pyrroline-5-carboxylate dehydrogenase
MSIGRFNVPSPKNEPVLNYAPGSPERKTLQESLEALSANPAEIPLIINGEEVRTGNLAQVFCPHDKRRLLATYHKAGAKEIQTAVAAANKAWPEWAAMPWEARLSVFLKAADLLAGKYRFILNAATMLNQSKTAFQAEIDAACELIDFFRFNCFYAQQVYAMQPESSPGMWNYLEMRPLEGFVFAVTPFNFTSIAGNLPSAPALMGNTVIWKPASSVVFSNYQLMKLWQEAGLPPGVINFLPGSAGQVGDPVLSHTDLAGVHFTGSTAVFQGMWSLIGRNIAQYKTYPRIVGETGGKDFVVVHASADPEAAATALIRGAFEFQGQKCSAASRAYIPDTLWPKLKELLVNEIKTIRIGDVQDLSNFMGAVIDRSAFDSIKKYIAYAKSSVEAKIVVGGECDDSKGYFIQPTVVLTTNPHFKLMEEEIFGPVLTVYVYPQNKFEETLELCNRTSPYGLTGAIMAQDRMAITKAFEALRFAAGNFYINDKPTGAVVGQQPFGGSRASGTNDKAGSMLNLLRWVSPRTIKETFVPPRDYRYPFLAKE